MKPKRNYSKEVLLRFMSNPSDLPGIDHKDILWTLPLIIREDGYVLPTKPMGKWKWRLRYFLAFFLPIGRSLDNHQLTYVDYSEIKKL